MDKMNAQQVAAKLLAHKAKCETFLEHAEDPILRAQITHQIVTTNKLLAELPAIEVRR